MIIPLKTFTGEFPKTNATLLPDNAAQKSVDCDFISGTLKGIRARDPLGYSAPGIKSMFFYKGGVPGVERPYWWNRDVDAVSSPIVDDRHDRFYWSDGTNFFVSQGSFTPSDGNGEPDASNKFRVGVPRPDSAGIDAIFEMHAITGMLTPYLYDERKDGWKERKKQAKDTAITGNAFSFGINNMWNNWSRNELSASFKFKTSQAPQEASESSETSTAAVTKASAGDWIAMSKDITIGGKAYPSFVKKGTEKLNPQTLVFYYNDPVPINSASANLTGTTAAATTAQSDTGTTDADGNTIFETVTVAAKTQKFYRLQNTMWYSNVQNTIAPYSTDPDSAKVISAKVRAPVRGPVVELPFKLKKSNPDGSEGYQTLKAYVREDPADSTWPIELGNMTASLSVEIVSPVEYSENTGNLIGNGEAIYTVTITAAAVNVANRAYVYTYVNAFGEEGPPSEPVLMECAEDATITVSCSPPTPQTPDYVPIEYVRLYRTATGASTSFLYVPNVDDPNGWPVGESWSAPLDIVDDVKTEALGEPVSTINAYPPSQELRGLCLMSNGVVAGFVGNEVHFMEPYLPYACNPSAIKPFPSQVTGICPFESGLYVTTIDHPYYVIGATPATMTDAKLTAIQAGVSKNAIVNMGQYVAYVSNDGIVMARGMEASLEKSFQFFTRNEWRSRFGAVLDKMHLSVHDGSLVAWIADDTDSDGYSGFLMRFEEENPSLVRLSDPITAAYVHPQADALYVADSNGIGAFKAGASTVPFIWRSKDFAQQKPTNFGAVQLIGTGTVTLRVYADDVLRLTSSVSMNTEGVIVRLPSGFLARRWSLELESSTDNVEVQEANMVTSVSELQGV